MPARRCFVFMGLVVGVSYVALATADDDDAFPYRSDYGDVRFIGSEELSDRQDSGEVVIVDVRSKIEFDVIHPVEAVHIPVSNMRFVKRVKALVEKHPGKTIAFYCNGVTCLKSYEAARKAATGGVKGCYAYDAGIPEWARLYPRKTLLLGKTLTDPERQLIPKAAFKRRCLGFEAFRKMSRQPDVMVLDVRDRIQDSGELPGVKTTTSIPLDRLIPNFVEKRQHQDKTLLIFDQVGKQVRWLQYYLVDKGYTKFYFLRGGATAVLRKQSYR